MSPSSSHETSQVGQRVSEISSLLHSLDESATEDGQSETRTRSVRENQLVQVRLGLASGLFTALQCKHAPTAAHSLRVALGCSAWTFALDVTDEERDAIEVAALLHDVGKIGMPDHMLTKPGKLTPDEEMVMRKHHLMGLEILATCCSSEAVLDIIRYSSAWFDGRRRTFSKQGKDIPLGARIVAIMDAYDSMTTDHVYRPARSRERALAELFEAAGTQFDPDLMHSFAELQTNEHFPVNKKVAQRWLESLNAEDSTKHWELNTNEHGPNGSPSTNGPFEEKLLGNMHDGVVFLDSQLQIFLWNNGAERLTGISASAAQGRRWAPRLLDLHDNKGKIIPEEKCPVATAIVTGVQSLERFGIRGRNDKKVPIDLHVVPVVGSDGTTYGATLMLHDASPETSLEERCQNLLQKATKDPLTQVANRAEFDRMHELFIIAHQETNLTCSLIICDIDHFKMVNDNFGHQAGDEAIKSFAGLLKNMAHSGDLAARYGGEEFVLLCADCNNASAVQRAEQLRLELADFQQSMLGSKRITASFGVTELQPGDTPETMLRRADRALLQAKDLGRNMVIQLGTGMVPQPERRGWWPFGLSSRLATPNLLLETQLVTTVPFAVAVQKLRGFVADHSARITETGDDYLQLLVDSSRAPNSRRRADRSVPFVIELKFSEDRVESLNSQGVAMGEQVQTKVHAVIRPQRNRDRRQDKITERAREMLHSLKSYLMAEEVEDNDDENALKKATTTIAPWLKKKES